MIIMIIVIIIIIIIIINCYFNRRPTNTLSGFQESPLKHTSLDQAWGFLLAAGYF